MNKQSWYKFKDTISVGCLIVFVYILISVDEKIEKFKDWKKNGSNKSR